MHGDCPTQKQNVFSLPQEAVSVLNPLFEELLCDWFICVWHVYFFKQIKQHCRIIIQCSYYNLEAHCTQF